MISVNITELQQMFDVVLSAEGRIHTVFAVEGDSGVGKTALITQIASRFGFDLRTINCNHLNLEDLSLPVVVDNHVQIKLSRLFAPPKDGCRGVLLFVDELTRPSSDGVGNAVMTMICERKVTGVTIPENFVFITAYNPSDTGEYVDTRNIFDDLAARRRYARVRLMFDADEFLAYHRTRMHPDLFAFLTQHPESILVKGSINCPRQWERLSESMMKKKEWTEDDETMLMIISSTHMDVPTLALWMKFWRGNLERFVTAVDMFDDWEKAKPTIDKNVENHRMDLIEATGKDLLQHLNSVDTVPVEHFRVIKKYLLSIPKAQARVLVDALMPISKEEQLKAHKSIYDYFGADKFGEIDSDQEFTALIISLA